MWCELRLKELSLGEQTNYLSAIDGSLFSFGGRSTAVLISNVPPNDFGDEKNETVGWSFAELPFSSAPSSIRLVSCRCNDGEEKGTPADCGRPLSRWVKARTGHVEAHCSTSLHLFCRKPSSFLSNNGDAASCSQNSSNWIISKTQRNTHTHSLSLFISRSTSKSCKETTTVTTTNRSNVQLLQTGEKEKQNKQTNKQTNKATTQQQQRQPKSCSTFLLEASFFSFSFVLLRNGWES